jgi:large subunit ribosomal protein L23
MDNFQIIRRPIVTERSTDLKEKRKLIFQVDIRANKREVKRAVEALFNTKVDKVNTVRVKGKPKRMGAHAGRRSNWKKAVVTIQEGQKLDLFGE